MNELAKLQQELAKIHFEISASKLPITLQLDQLKKAFLLNIQLTLLLSERAKNEG